MEKTVIASTKGALGIKYISFKRNTSFQYPSVKSHFLSIIQAFTDQRCSKDIFHCLL